ncbi:MAG: protein tyrosine phosphatase family protein [Pseudomonadota bacterium]|nr:protein tyrosine phosphatase family protein [Pseudomonadota bacterium]
MEATLVPIPNAKQPETGILTGGQPTAEQLDQAQAAGYKTIVNLRPAAEMKEWNEAQKVEQLGMKYVLIPVAGGADLSDTNTQALDAVLANPDNYPVMVHCASGNRVGALFALRAARIQGKDAEEALKIGEAAGLTGLAPVVRELLAK